MGMSDGKAISDQTDVHRAARFSGSQRLTLGILLGVFAFSTVDRAALGLVSQDIKLSFGLSDIQLGLLNGIAFTFFYCLMGIPIARLADRGDRVRLIAISAALWSAAVIVSGLATGFLFLLVARAAVAIGEAGCVPPANSLIADRFDRGQRPRASAIFLLGLPLSGVLGLALGGWLNQLFGWRVMFMLLAAPGLILAVAAWLFLEEPRRSMEIAAPGSPAPAALKTLPALAALCRIPSFRHLIIGVSISNFFGSGIGHWIPVYFIRSFGLKTSTLGIWLALVIGLGGFAATYGGGALASRFAADNEKLQLRAIAAGFVVFALASTTTYLSTNVVLSFACYAVSALGAMLIFAPLVAILQSSIPPHLRALAMAILLFFSNLIGSGLGPLAAGALSDLFAPSLGNDSLRYALLALCPGYVWAGFHMLRASRSVAGDIAAAELQETAAEVAEQASNSNSGNSQKQAS